MTGQIFISYRREESSAWAGRLSDRLSNNFPSNQIFMDVDSLDLGEDFVKTIEKTVESCDVLIAVIGKGWLSSRDQEGQRRLDNPEDFVRIEIATALKRDIRVIPVLVDGASMPQSRDLPDDLKALVRRNALQLSHDRFHSDSERLASAVERALEKTAVEQREREEQERLAAERRETELKERLEAERQPEADEPSSETPKVVYPLAAKPSPRRRVKPARPSSSGVGGKTPSKQVIAFLAIAAVLAVAGVIYLATRASQPPPPQRTPVGPSLTVRSKSVGPQLQLRSEKSTLSVDEARKMILVHNFYRAGWNASETGIKHQYETQVLDGSLVVVDHAAGLMWQKGGSGEPVWMQKAEQNIRDLNAKKWAGFNDWRLPTLEEAMSLMTTDKGAMPEEVMSGDERAKGVMHLDPAFEKGVAPFIWTSDSESPERAWVVYFWDAKCVPESIDFNAYVRAVRSSANK